jgi:hypothetical protein
MKIGFLDGLGSKDVTVEVTKLCDGPKSARWYAKESIDFDWWIASCIFIRYDRKSLREVAAPQAT